MKRKWLYLTGIVIVILIFVWIKFKPGKSGSEQLVAQVKKGNFEMKVTVTGELEAKTSTNIFGPDGLRMVGIWGEIKINEMIPEGTVVKEGDWVATLDKTEISSKMKDLESELEKFQTQYEKAKLDTTLEMRNNRDDLINLKYSYEEQQITVDQSIYEPPATQQQAKIELDKRKRAYSQAVTNYQLKLKQAAAKVQETETSLMQAKRKYENLMNVMNSFNVIAPKAGMVIYRRGWNGQKQGAGSTISAWNNVVAQLPDLREMNSKTYVNEIDISKIKVGQIVNIGVDAFPDKRLTGVVYEVANIGEQLNNTDAKVFEVVIQVNEYDSILRPAMTTKNEIVTGIFQNVMYVPIESIHNADSLVYVFKKKGGKIYKQEVITGKSNENEIIIRAGLEPDDEVLLNIPEGMEDKKIEKLNLSKEQLKKLADEEQKKEKTILKPVKKAPVNKEQGQGGDEFIFFG